MKSKKSEDFIADKLPAPDFASALGVLTAKVTKFIGSYKNKWRGLQGDANKKTRRLRNEWDRHEREIARLEHMRDRVAKAEAAQRSKAAKMENDPKPTLAPRQSFSERIAGALA